MDRESCERLWKDESKEAINTLKFLDLLLKYRCIWHQQNEERKLNLTETNKRLFLIECCETIEYMDELKASVNIAILSYQFTQQLSKLQKGEFVEYPWFFLAYKIFQKPPTSKTSSIASPSTPADTVAYNMSAYRVPTFTTKEASTSASASYPSSMSAVVPLSQTTLPSHWKLQSYVPEIHSTNPYLSLRNAYESETTLQNGNLQYNFQVLYPFCILPCFSLGLLGKSPDISRFRSESEYLSGNETSSNLSLFSQQHMSDFSYLSGNYGISDPIGSYHTGNQYFQINNLDRNSEKPATSCLPRNLLNSKEPIATGYTVFGSFPKNCKYLRNEYSHEPSQSSLIGTSTSTVCNAITSTSSDTVTFSSLPRGQTQIPR